MNFIDACKYNDIDQVNILIQKGSDIDQVDENNYTGFTWACEYGHIDIIKLLIKKGANINHDIYDGKTGLILACKNNRIDVVELLIKNKMDINYQNKKGQTIFIIACKHAYTDMVKFLLQFNDSINIYHKDLWGYDGFMWICKKGFMSIFELLIDKYLNKNMLIESNNMNDQNINFILAAQSWNINIMKYLIDHNYIEQNNELNFVLNFCYQFDLKFNKNTLNNDLIINYLILL